MKIVIETPSKDNRFRICIGSGKKRVLPQKLTYWLTVYLKKAIDSEILGTSLGGKKPSVSVLVKYIGEFSNDGEPMTNETVKSMDFNYLHDTTLIFLEDYITKYTLSKKKTKSN